MSDSVRPHRRQSTRLPHLRDSPGKNTGVGCHFLLWCMKVKSENEVAQSCLILRDPMDCSPPGSSIHGIFQARVLEWVISAFSITNLDSILKSKDTTLPTKVHRVKDMVFPVATYGCESWTINEAEHSVVLEKTFESPLDYRETKLVNPNGNQLWIFIGRTDAEAEAPILWPPDGKSPPIGKAPDAAKRLPQWLKWIKNPPATQETWVRSLSQEDPLEKEMVTPTSILAWKITWIEEPGRLQSIG